jgi:signal transduction histidine kinase
VVAPSGDPGSDFVRTRGPSVRRYVGVVNRVRTLLTTHGLDVLIVALAVAAAVGIAGRNDPSRPEGSRLAFEVAAVAVMIAALVLRRRAPLVVPAATWLVSAALSFLDGRLIVGQGPISIAGMVAAVLLGNLREVRQARVGLAVVVVSATCVVLNDPTHSSGDLFFTPLLFAVGWLVGFALHERAEQTEAAEQRAERAERERESAARVAVAEERARIARELHDVVAHAVSVMVLQVGAVRHRMSDEDAEDRKALLNVEQAGRTALAEMRRLLDAMRREEDQLDLAPQPGMDKLPALLADVRAAGLDVRFEVRGDPVALSRGLDLSAYRIIQEGLTNALKHARAQHAIVRVRYGAADLELEVHDDGRGTAGSDGSGHGLVGIGERVKIFGGEMDAGTAPHGGFVLRARLPMDATVT